MADLQLHNPLPAQLFREESRDHLTLAVRDHPVPVRGIEATLPGRDGLCPSTCSGCDGDELLALLTTSDDLLTDGHG